MWTPTKVLLVFCGYFAHQIANCDILPGSKWSVFLLRQMLQEAMTKVFDVFS